jgi:hypothetical protein
LAEAARQRTQVQTAFEIKNITERPPFSSSSCAARVTFPSISVNFIIGGRHGFILQKRGCSQQTAPRNLHVWMVQKGSTGLQMARIAGEALLFYSTAIVAAKNL